MLHYNRIDIAEGNDPTESNKNKECMICHYWFFNHGFKFQDSVCNGWHTLTILIVNIRNIAIIIIKNVDYHCIIHNIIKPETINLLKKSPLENQGYIRKNVAKIISFNRVISYKNFPK